MNTRPPYRLTTLTAGIAMALLAASASGDDSWVHPAYEDTVISGRSLSIVMYRAPYVYSSAEIDEETFSGSDWRRKVEAVIRGAMKKYLLEEGMFTRCVFDSITDRSAMVYAELKMKDDGEEKRSGWYYYLPRSSGSPVTLRATAPGIVLFITSLRVTASESWSVGISAGVGPGGTGMGVSVPRKSEDLTVYCRYLFWDNRAGRVVSLGTLTIDDSGEMDIDDVEDAVEDLVEEMLDDTPFEQ